MYVENRTLRITETKMSWRRKMLTTGMSRCEPSIIGVWCKNDMKMTLHAMTGNLKYRGEVVNSSFLIIIFTHSVINTAQKLDEMMLRTTMAALFHPTTKLYCLPLKAFVSHSLHKPQRLVSQTPAVNKSTKLPSS
ncbi:unnamed protein product [Lactuca virosa]|uniref:Uncharacterized protein n=1 Tax=Lactuca virosa TaxID=75947 RepID=A0AAU9PWE8_9ASTR|nr:unnamed protein product [Lactuca virosa]